MNYEHAKTYKGRRRGASHPKAKLSDADVVLMRYLHRERKWGYGRLGKRFRCAKSTAQHICNSQRRCIKSPEEDAGYA